MNGAQCGGVRGLIRASPCRRGRGRSARSTSRPGPGGRRCGAEVGRPALAGLHGRGRPHALLGGVGRGAGRRGEVAAGVGRGRKAASAGAKASTMVLSPAAAAPSFCTLSRPASQRDGELLGVGDRALASALPDGAEGAAVQRSRGPADPEISVVPVLTSTSPTVAGSEPARAAVTAEKPRSMLTPWSASPMAESSWVSSRLFFATAAATACTQARARRCPRGLRSQGSAGGEVGEGMSRVRGRGPGPDGRETRAPPCSSQAPSAGRGCPPARPTGAAFRRQPGTR